MKAVMVLQAGPELAQRAADLKGLLQCLKSENLDWELWLLSEGSQPQEFPILPITLNHIELIKLEPPPLPEAILAALQHLHAHRPQELYLFASDALADELATRLGFRLGGSSCLQVKSLKLQYSKLLVKKPAYTHHMRAGLVYKKAPYCISASPSAAAPVEMGPAPCPVSVHENPVNQQADWIINSQFEPNPPPCGLAQAKVVLAVGQGVGNKQNLAILEKIAQALGAELGASRPVVMNAWTGMERLIGVSGQVLAPKVCIAAGVSGSAAFSLGIKNSELIIAVNIDDQAPIYNLAQIGVKEDLMAFLVELQKLLEIEPDY